MKNPESIDIKIGHPFNLKEAVINGGINAEIKTLKYFIHIYAGKISNVLVAFDTGLFNESE